MTWAAALHRTLAAVNRFERRPAEDAANRCSRLDCQFSIEETAPDDLIPELLPTAWFDRYRIALRALTCENIDLIRRCEIFSLEAYSLCVSPVEFGVLDSRAVDWVGLHSAVCTPRQTRQRTNHLHPCSNSFLASMPDLLCRPTIALELHTPGLVGSTLRHHRQPETIADTTERRRRESGAVGTYANRPPFFQDQIGFHDLESLVEVCLQVQQCLLRGRRNHHKCLFDVVGFPLALGRCDVAAVAHGPGRKGLPVYHEPIVVALITDLKGRFTPRISRSK